jgi:hypothetical protein
MAMAITLTLLHRVTDEELLDLAARSPATGSSAT